MNVIVFEYLSLDGVMQAPGHASEDPHADFAHGGWTAGFMTDHRRYLSDAFEASGGFLLGRFTYEIFAAYWPTVTDPDDKIAGALNSLPKYVASTTLKEASWPGSTVITDVPRAVARLKQQRGRPLRVIGSSQLAATLMAHDLVDEYQLWLHPVVLGGGKRLFAEGAARFDLRLVDCTTTKSGLVIATYSPAAA